MNLTSSILKAIRIWFFTSIILAEKLFINLSNGQEFPFNFTFYKSVAYAFALIPDISST